MSKKAFVTGANDRYFPLMLELIHSLLQFEESPDIDICVMDTGLTAEQTEILTKTSGAIKIITPDWPVDLPEKKIKGRTYLKSCICRPFIPDIFPGYDQYLWLDADTWVQNWEAIDLFLRGAQDGKMACTVLVDRAFPKSGRLQFFGPFPIKPKSFYYSNAKRSLGYKAAQKLYGYNIVSAGAFSLLADAPHWKAWQINMLKILKKGKIFTAEQLALGVIAHLENHPMEYLPSWCHWAFMKHLRWDEQKNLFTEPYLPHMPIGIMHLSGLDEMRVDRSCKTSVKTGTGESRMMSLRYPYFDGETNEPLPPHTS